MASYTCCKTCGKWGWADVHTCPPTWQVEIDGSGFWREVYAADEGEAAELAAEEEDCEGDYCVIRNGSATALVKRDDSDEIKTVLIEAESVATYHGRLQP